MIRHTVTRRLPPVRNNYSGMESCACLRRCRYDIDTFDRLRRNVRSLLYETRLLFFFLYVRGCPPAIVDYRSSIESTRDPLPVLFLSLLSLFLDSFYAYEISSECPRTSLTLSRPRATPSGWEYFDGALAATFTCKLPLSGNVLKYLIAGVMKEAGFDRGRKLRDSLVSVNGERDSERKREEEKERQTVRTCKPGFE